MKKFKFQIELQDNTFIDQDDILTGETGISLKIKSERGLYDLIDSYTGVFGAKIDRKEIICLTIEDEKIDVKDFIKKHRNKTIQYENKN